MISYPEKIRNRDGEVIHKSRSYAGVRRFVGKTTFSIKAMSIDKMEDDGGRLCILWSNGDNYETNFASFKVLADWVRRWRNVHGAPIFVNGEDAGHVSSTNPNL